ncbi:hypothetical protein V8F20_000904 [Naviculisporaceae sp. PSN 640]
MGDRGQEVFDRQGRLILLRLCQIKCNPRTEIWGSGKTVEAPNGETRRRKGLYYGGRRSGPGQIERDFSAEVVGGHVGFWQRDVVREVHDRQSLTGGVEEAGKVQVGKSAGRLAGRGKSPAWSLWSLEAKAGLWQVQRDSRKCGTKAAPKPEKSRNKPPVIGISASWLPYLPVATRNVNPAIRICPDMRSKRLRTRGSTGDHQQHRAAQDRFPLDQKAVVRVAYATTPPSAFAGYGCDWRQREEAHTNILIISDASRWKAKHCA